MPTVPPFSTLSEEDAAKILPLLQTVQADIDAWYERSCRELADVKRRVADRVDHVRAQILQMRGPPQQHTFVQPVPVQGVSRSRTPPPSSASGASGAPTTPIHSSSSVATASHQELLQTPPPGSKLHDFGSPPAGSEKMSVDTLLLNRMQPVATTGAMRQPPAPGGSNSPPINFDTLYEQLTADGTPKGGTSPTMPLPHHPSIAAAAAGAGGDYHGSNGAVARGLESSYGSLASPIIPSPSAGGGGSASSVSILPIDAMLQMQGQQKTRNAMVTGYENGRSVVSFDPTIPDDELQATPSPASGGYQVLVEFKRRRVLRYTAVQYYHPGSHVVVVGDRGEDIGLVTYIWVENPGSPPVGIGLAGASLTRVVGLGNGRVVRKASRTDVTQLLVMQAELERRAVDVCQQRVLEHGVPMVIVDAEYQFDKKKLTFFFESQQRLDFRELVRDLFKTFRARIWMESVTQDGK